MSEEKPTVKIEKALPSVQEKINAISSAQTKLKEVENAIPSAQEKINAISSAQTEPKPESNSSENNDNS